jgi:hypothetical protein
VRVVWPGHPANGCVGRVARLEEWGAYLSTNATATTRLRVLWEEMELIGDADLNGTTTVLRRDTDTPSLQEKHRERDMGYTGDVCLNCQSSRMVRDGSCLKCQDCGQTTGCT